MLYFQMISNAFALYVVYIVYDYCQDLLNNTLNATLSNALEASRSNTYTGLPPFSVQYCTVSFTMVSTKNG